MVDSELVFLPLVQVDLFILFKFTFEVNWWYFFLQIYRKNIYHKTRTQNYFFQQRQKRFFLFYFVMRFVARTRTVIVWITTNNIRFDSVYFHILLYNIIYILLKDDRISYVTHSDDSYRSIWVTCYDLFFIRLTFYDLVIIRDVMICVWLITLWSAGKWWHYDLILFVPFYWIQMRSDCILTKNLITLLCLDGQR